MPVCVGGCVCVHGHQGLCLRKKWQLGIVSALVPLISLTQSCPTPSVVHLALTQRKRTHAHIYMLWHTFELICNLLNRLTDPFNTSCEQRPHFLPNTYTLRITGTQFSLSLSFNMCVELRESGPVTFTQKGICARMTGRDVLGRIRFVFKVDITVDKMWRVLDSTLDCIAPYTRSWY